MIESEEPRYSAGSFACAQDDGGERMRNKEGIIKVKVKVKVNGKLDAGWRCVHGPICDL